MKNIKNKLKKTGIVLAMLGSLMGCEKEKIHHQETALHTEVWTDPMYADTSRNGYIKLDEVSNVYELAGRSNPKIRVGQYLGRLRPLPNLDYGELQTARDILKNDYNKK